MAQNFGTTRNWAMLNPMLLSASISSWTTMVANSAVMAEPERAITMIAVISGANSLAKAMPTRSAT
jgi:hypothetical protein